MCRSYKIGLSTVLQSDVDGDILLLPVRVRHVENARAQLSTLWYTPLRRITFKATFKATTFVNVTCVFHSCSRLQGTIRFSTSVDSQQVY